MNDTFSTSDFGRLCKFIKPLLDEEHEIRIRVDCEGVFMVDYVDAVFSGERFMHFDEEKDLLEGYKIKYVEDYADE